MALGQGQILRKILENTLSHEVKENDFKNSSARLFNQIRSTIWLVPFWLKLVQWFLCNPANKQTHKQTQPWKKT